MKGGHLIYQKQVRSIKSAEVIEDYLRYLKVTVQKHGKSKSKLKNQGTYSMKSHLEEMKVAGARMTLKHIFLMFSEFSSHINRLHLT